MKIVNNNTTKTCESYQCYLYQSIFGRKTKIFQDQIWKWKQDKNGTKNTNNREKKMSLCLVFVDDT